MSTQQFVENRFYKLLNQDDEDGVTYIIQYTAVDILAYNKYANEFASLLHNKAQEKWKTGFVIFDTVMQSI